MKRISSTRHRLAQRVATSPTPHRQAVQRILSVTALAWKVALPRASNTGPAAMTQQGPLSRLQTLYLSMAY